MKYTLNSLKESTKSKTNKKDALSQDKRKEWINKIMLLILVVEEVEYYAALDHLSEVQRLTDEKNWNCYCVGKWGEIPAALFKLDTHGADKSQDITEKSIVLFHNLKFIIALGVCGTTKETAHVLVSSEIYRYCQPKKPTDEIFDSSDITNPGLYIRKCLNDTYQNWSFECTEEGYTSKAEFKRMLSGTHFIASGDDTKKLIDDVDKNNFGVEMEGIGVISGIKEKNKKIEFIIVKGGCNYADKDKNEKWQPVAAMAAADFLYKQLNTPTYVQLFKCKGISM